MSSAIILLVELLLFSNKEFKLSDLWAELLSKFCQRTLSEIIHNGNFLVYSMGSVCFSMDTTFSVSYYGFGMELASNLMRIVEKYK